MDSIIDQIVTETVGCSINCSLSAAASAHVARCNDRLVHAIEARRLPLTDRTFSAPPPPSPGQRRS